MRLSILVAGDVTNGWTETVTARLAHTSGTDTQLQKYRAKGSTTLTAPLGLGPPIQPVTFPATFRLGQGPPIKGIQPVDVVVPVTVTLNADGSVGAVRVGHST